MGDLKLDIDGVRSRYYAKSEMDRRSLPDILRAAGDGDIYNVNPLNFAPEVGGNIGWDHLSTEEESRILAGMVRHTLLRHMAQTPFVEALSLSERDVKDIQTLDDVLQVVPPNAKDSIGGTNIGGFRQWALSDSGLFLPRDLVGITDSLTSQWRSQELLSGTYENTPIWRFGSGGSRGGSTFTTLSYLDLEMESYASAFRCKLRGGFLPGKKFLTLYNETHKGGKELIRVGQLLGVQVITKNMMLEDLRNLDHDYDKKAAGNPQYVAHRWNQYIKDKKIEIVAGVQPPAEFIAKNAKGNMVSFMDIYNIDPSSFDSVEVAFITGFPVPKDTYETLRSNGIAVFTTWGATEAMAIGTYPLDNPPSDEVNDLVRVNFPNIGMLVRYGKKGEVMRAREGEYGALAITNVFRIGSPYIHYLIGDIAQATRFGLRNTTRLASSDALTNSCATDALDTGARRAV